MFVKQLGAASVMVDEALPMPSADELRLSELVKALSDQNRLKIVIALADGLAHSTIDLPDLEVQKSTLSHHLRTLRLAGFTETHVVGRSCSIRLRRDELDARFPGFIDALTSPAAQASLAG
jgi:DNA-binding transcriptional ArsR family regulator